MATTLGLELARASGPGQVGAHGGSEGPAPTARDSPGLWGNHAAPVGERERRCRHGRTERIGKRAATGATIVSAPDSVGCTAAPGVAFDHAAYAFRSI